MLVQFWGVHVPLGSPRGGGSLGSAVAGGDLHGSGRTDFTWPKEELGGVAVCLNKNVLDVHIEESERKGSV